MFIGEIKSASTAKLYHRMMLKNPYFPVTTRFVRLMFIPSLTALLLAGTTPPAAARDVTKFYAENCANCHGKNLEGAQAPSMLDDEWKHGGDDASIAHTISEGFITNGMPPWKAVLTGSEIRAMVVFIREKAEQARRAKTVFAKPADRQAIQSRAHSFRLVNVVEGLAAPWSIAFLPDGRMLVTELAGRLRIVQGGRLLLDPVAGTPVVFTKGQGGLLDVAPHPGFASNGWVYLTFSHPLTNASGGVVAMTSVVRGHIKDNGWADEQVIFRADPATYRPTPIHFGSRLVFDGDGHLFFSIGERGFKENAQDLTRPNGKVHRVFDDGRIPTDNPFVNVSNAVPSIWSYGHRNPQGLVWNTATGDLWETEHGPRGGDELNLVRKGLNYGWPEITYGMHYDGSPVSELTAKEGMEQPVIFWTPSIAVCSMDFYFGDKFPRWRGNLFVTALAQQELRRLVLDGRRVTEQEVLFKDIGRVRDVVSGPDGCLYVAFNNPDRIARVEPLGEGTSSTASAAALNK
jgi:aldose sugar dehydrogenase